MPCATNRDWIAGCGTQRDCRRQQQQQISEAGEQSDETSCHLTATAAASHSSSHGRRSRNPRRRRGYRLFHRPVAVHGNYYAMPFPPPETLRLAAGFASIAVLGDDGDSRSGGDKDSASGDAWQDLEIRVISHDGVTVWQDLQTRSDAEPDRWRQPHRRKFFNRRRLQQQQQRLRQPHLQQARSSESVKSESPSAVLSIEAVISVREASPKRQSQQRRTVSASNQSGAARVRQASGSGSGGAENAGGFSRLDERLLRKVQQIQRLQAVRMRQQPAARSHTSLPAFNGWQCARGQQQQQQQRQQNHRQLQSLKPSQIPIPINNWPRWLTAQPQTPQQQLNQSKTPSTDTQAWRQQTAANNRASRARRKLPSYMRPYSPMLEYPQPGRLPQRSRWQPQWQPANTGRH
ncbi:hypothetical protein BOX15_Mlig010995g3 [Macrostomum lignano]|uniref:Uncharacterized protein n=1 Tax=Macrostomum lignano TaxID=282301 RepID=A0A267DT35_9PLAT|nr:hypothetical protein BOX15_Mlig010995g3 [Macrostomum lignano]